jgi:hypothetical protein
MSGHSPSNAGTVALDSCTILFVARRGDAPAPDKVRPLLACRIPSPWRRRPLVRAPVAPPMDFRKILEKKSQAMKERQQRSIMIGGKRVKARLDIGEILLEKNGHICIKPSAVRNRQVCMGAPPRFLAVSSLCCLR